MIGSLYGTLVEKRPPQLTMDVNGVGYEVSTPMTTIYQLPLLGENLTLYTHLLIRETAHILYGFISRSDRDFFRELIRLNSVGPKLALALMSSLELDELRDCIQNQDISALLKIAGVGKKTAERILIDLRNRSDHFFTREEEKSISTESIDSKLNDIKRDTINALISLGYKEKEAIKSTSKIKDKTLSTESMIKQALKGML